MSTQRRRSSRGQVAVIFAVLSSALFATVGIAVDAGMAYLFANQAERAAASAALAGVPYMPDGYGTTANRAALVSSQRSGFNDGSSVNGYPVSVKVSHIGPVGCQADCQFVDDTCPTIAPCDPHKLGVKVTAAVPTTFLNLLGFTKTTVTQRAIALYLPPISLGQPGARLGPTKESDLQTGAAPYFLRVEGYGTPRSEGDAYTPDPLKNTGNACDAGSGYNDTNDIHTISGLREVPNSVMTSLANRMNALPSRGGYNFSVTVPASQTAKIQAFNPGFMMDGLNTGKTMHEGDSFPGTPNDPRWYSVMQYTVFKVVDQFDHTQDVPMTQVQFNPVRAQPGNNPSYWTDMRTGNNDSSIGNAASPGASIVYKKMVDVLGTPPSIVESDGSNMVNVFGPPASRPSSIGGGTYRVRVDTLDYLGRTPVDDGTAVPCSRAHKGYSLQVTDLGGTLCATCQLGGLTEMAIFTPIQGGSFNVPIMSIPPDYAGLPVHVFLFDPGDTSGDASVSLLDPNNNVVTDAANGIRITDQGVSKDGTRGVGPSGPNPDPVNKCLLGSQPNPAVATVVTNYTSNRTSVCDPPGLQFATNPWNGHWLEITFTVPTAYVPGYYQLKYVTTGSAADTVTVAVGTDSVAVHLLP